MDKKMAADVLMALNESTFVVDKALADIKANCPREQFLICGKLLGQVMADMFDSVMAPIYDEHLELAPEWYRDGPPRGRAELPKLEIDPATRRVLIDAFDAAYEKVQSIFGRLSATEDSREHAALREGLHLISAAICRAQVTLLHGRTDGDRR